MTKTADLPYRPCVGIVLFNRKGRVLVARRRDIQPAAWQLPQGGIDAGEKPETAAYRELVEEIGTANARTLGRTRGWLTYDLPEDLIGKAFKGRYRGQKQKWFALLFTGKKKDIDPVRQPDAEFDAWKWVALHDIPDLIVPFKRGVYEALVSTFADLAGQLKNRDIS